MTKQNKGLAALELYRRYVRKCKICGKKVVSGTPLEWMLNHDLIPKFLRPLKAGVVANVLNSDGTHKLDDEKHEWIQDYDYLHCPECAELVEINAQIKDLWTKYDVNKGQGYGKEDAMFSWVSDRLDFQLEGKAKRRRRT